MRSRSGTHYTKAHSSKWIEIQEWAVSFDVICRMLGFRTSRISVIEFLSEIGQQVRKPIVSSAGV